MSNIETVTWLARIFSLGFAAWLVCWAFAVALELLALFLPELRYAIALSAWHILITPFLYGTTMGFIALVGIFPIWEWELIRCIGRHDVPVGNRRDGFSQRDVLWLLFPVANLYKPLPVIRWSMSQAGRSLVGGGDSGTPGRMAHCRIIYSPAIGSGRRWRFQLFPSVVWRNPAFVANSGYGRITDSGSGAYAHPGIKPINGFRVK